MPPLAAPRRAVVRGDIDTIGASVPHFGPALVQIQNISAEGITHFSYEFMSAVLGAHDSFMTPLRSWPAPLRPRVHWLFPYRCPIDLVGTLSQ